MRRHTWATVVDAQVRVYRIERASTLVPHLWPLALGMRGIANGGREFPLQTTLRPPSSSSLS